MIEGTKMLEYFYVTFFNNWPLIEYDKIIRSTPQNNMTAARGLVEIVI
jgi:hypothetical protein